MKTLMVLFFAFVEALTGFFDNCFMVFANECGAITIGQVQALTVKGIESKGGVRDAIFKNHAYLARLKEKQGVYSGEKMTFPFNYLDDSSSNGKFYTGADALTLDMYDPITELAFDLVEIQETLVITSRDLARNSGKEARIKLIEQRLKLMETALQQRFTKGIFSDGTSGTGALTAKQFPGQQAFLKNSSVNYGGVTNTDIAVHVAYVNDNGGTDRALTTALHQDVLGGASEGNKKPTVGIMRQSVMNSFIELLKPHQRTTRESTLNGLGHEKNTLVYAGVDHIVDNLSVDKAIAFINEDHVKLYVHPEYDMARKSWDKLETQDSIMERLFWKGVYACDVLRYQSLLKDIAVS
jgi:hypothetical protein